MRYYDIPEFFVKNAISKLDLKIIFNIFCIDKTK